MNSGHLLWCPQKIELCHSREFFKADQDSKADCDGVDGMPYIVKVNKNLKCMIFFTESINGEGSEITA